MFGAADNQSNDAVSNAMPGVGTPYTMPPADPATSSTAPPMSDPLSSGDGPAQAVDAHMQPAYNYDTPGGDSSSASQLNLSDPATVNPMFAADNNTTSTSPAPTAPVNHDELMSLKEEALQHLGPMVGQLEQTPEERFKTLMMMIQASDDHTKLKEAFEIAKEITDDKVRAQALLDVINEINYFTQPPNSSNPGM